MKNDEEAKDFTKLEDEKQLIKVLTQMVSRFPISVFR